MRAYELTQQLWNHLPLPLKEGMKRVPVFGDLLQQIERTEAEIADLRARLGREGPRLFVPAGHFYSPLPDLHYVRARENTIFDSSVRDLPGIDLRRHAQFKLLGELQRYYAELPFSPEKSDGLRYYYDNGSFSYSDGIFLYCMLRHLRPRRFLEIGSGHPSALALDVNQHSCEGQIQMTFIEPFSERLFSQLREGDRERVRILERPLQDVELSLFEELQDGDVLFIDSTHVSKVGSDVNRIFFEILPRLAKGVYVHLHGIFYPFEYPREWVYEGRAWNEAYLLRAFLQYNAAFAVVLFGNYLARLRRPWFEQQMPLCLKDPGGSIWLRRREDADAAATGPG